ncbi:MAG: hypothetical protein JWM39_622 [Parcubacteria group bacterium]|nr:hypothetical protein [Parcubacteria group bacterium]
MMIPKTMFVEGSMEEQKLRAERIFGEQADSVSVYTISVEDARMQLVENAEIRWVIMGHLKFNRQEGLDNLARIIHRPK